MKNKKNAVFISKKYPTLSRNRTEYLETGQEVKIFKLGSEIKILLLNLIRDETSITIFFSYVAKKWTLFSDFVV